MSHKIYTLSQIKELLSHPGVLSCTEKYLSFTPAFKRQALDLYMKEFLSPHLVFKHLGLPEFITDTDIPRNTLKNWKRRLMVSGDDTFTSKKKGRPRSPSPPGFSSSFDELEYLRAKVAYLEEENKTFKLIRAGKYKL